MKTPEEYSKLLNTTYTNFEMGLYNISKSYPLYKTYQNDDSYKKEYLKDLNNLEKNKKNMFLYKNGLHSDSNTIEQRISKKNNKITDLNKQNAKLVKKLNTLVNEDSAADGELTNRHYIYNINLAQNIILVTTMVGSVGLYILKR